MKFTLATMLFLGLTVLAVADPKVEEKKKGPNDPLNDDQDIEVERRRQRGPPGWRTFLICEGKVGKLQCHRGQRIVVHYANYGRTTGRNVCPHRSIRSTHCTAPRSSISIRRACNNKQSCVLYANNRKYGDPCRGTYKYIEVKYSCARLFCKWKYY